MGELVQLSSARFCAVVQGDAAELLPRGVVPLKRTTSSGARRALQGMGSYGRADLIHGLDVDLPLRPGAPTVATVHDLSVFDVPWAFSKVRARGEQLLVSRSLQQADELVAVSHFTARRIKERFGRNAHVAHLAPSTEFVPASSDAIAEVRKRWALPERFLLHVGTIEPRKNVGALVRAAGAVGVPLVLAGSQKEELPSGPEAGEVMKLGWVATADLPALYSAATVVSFPSRYEGFGLPPVEAMACGAPVVTTTVGALPEVLENVTLLDPEDEAGLIDTLRDLLADDDYRQAWAETGMKDVANLSWRRTAEQNLAVYRSLGIDG